MAPAPLAPLAAPAAAALSLPLALLASAVTRRALATLPAVRAKSRALSAVYDARSLARVLAAVLAAAAAAAALLALLLCAQLAAGARLAEACAARGAVWLPGAPDSTSLVFGFQALLIVQRACQVPRMARALSVLLYAQIVQIVVRGLFLALMVAFVIVGYWKRPEPEPAAVPGFAWLDYSKKSIVAAKSSDSAYVPDVEMQPQKQQLPPPARASRTPSKQVRPFGADALSSPTLRNRTPLKSPNAHQLKRAPHSQKQQSITQSASPVTCQDMNRTPPRSTQEHQPSPVHGLPHSLSSTVCSPTAGGFAPSSSKTQTSPARSIRAPGGVEVTAPKKPSILKVLQGHARKARNCAPTNSSLFARLEDWVHRSFVDRYRNLVLSMMVLAASFGLFGVGIHIHYSRYGQFSSNPTELYGMNSARDSIDPNEIFKYQPRDASFQKRGTLFAQAVDKCTREQGHFRAVELDVYRWFAFDADSTQLAHPCSEAAEDTVAQFRTTAVNLVQGLKEPGSRADENWSRMTLALGYFAILITVMQVGVTIALVGSMTVPRASKLRRMGLDPTVILACALCVGSTTAIGLGAWFGMMRKQGFSSIVFRDSGVVVISMPHPVWSPVVAHVKWTTWVAVTSLAIELTAAQIVFGRGDAAQQSQSRGEAGT